VNASVAPFGRLAAAWALLAFGAMGAAQGVSPGVLGAPRSEPAVAELLAEPAGQAFLEAYRAILRDYRGDVDAERLLQGALRGLVAALDDPYVRYLSPEEVVADAVARRDPNVVVTGVVGDLGYLRVTSFDSERAGERFATELDGLLVRGVRALVLDLRGNGGGLVLPGLQVLDRFLSDVVLGYRMGAGARVPLGFANPSALGLPVAVLVDGGTASTAEIVAGALQSYGRARLYGSVTAGKGVGQSGIALPDGGELRLVTFAWSLPDGRSIDGWGLTPDLPVRSEATGAPVDPVDAVTDPERDPVLAAALADLRRTLGDDLTEGLGQGEPRVPDPAPISPDR
jgi:C-terminal processing protease CtpA/Prc